MNSISSRTRFKLVLLAVIFVSTSFADNTTIPVGVVATANISEVSNATTIKISLQPVVLNNVTTSLAVKTTQRDAPLVPAPTVPAPHVPLEADKSPPVLQTLKRKEQIPEPQVEEFPPPADIQATPPTTPSHHLTLLIIVMAICGCFYCVKNKSKIMGLIVEGRAGRNGSRRGGNVHYRRLSTNEADVESGL